MNLYRWGSSTVHEHWLATLPCSGRAAAGFDRPGIYRSSTAPVTAPQAADTCCTSPGMKVVTRAPGTAPVPVLLPPCTSATTTTTAPTTASPIAGQNHAERR